MVPFIEHFAHIMILLEEAILALLAALCVADVAIFVWRLRAYDKAKGDTQKWTELLTKNLKLGTVGIAELGKTDTDTILGRVVKTGVDNWGLAPEAMEKVFEVQESTEKRHLNRGISFLGTVGANAAFLGLTGTVIGILVAFDRFAASGGRGSTEVMVAISQSLLATAMGLLVAIPAVVFYNILRDRSKMILEQAREIQGLILAHSLHATFTRVES